MLSSSRLSSAAFEQAYGIVWKAIDKKTREVLALKKIFDAFQNATDAQVLFSAQVLQSHNLIPGLLLHHTSLVCKNYITRWQAAVFTLWYHQQYSAVANFEKE